MSRFTDADEAATPRPRAVQCRICLFIAELPADEAADLRRLLADRSPRHMVRVLASCGFKTQKSSVETHQARHGD